jgi:hypothetical protein
VTHLVVATHLHTVTPTTNKPENDNESASHGPGVLGEEVAIDAAFRSSFSCGFNDASDSCTSGADAEGGADGGAEGVSDGTHWHAAFCASVSSPAPPPGTNAVKCIIRGQIFLTSDCVKSQSFSDIVVFNIRRQGSTPKQSQSRLRVKSRLMYSNVYLKSQNSPVCI